MGGFSGMLGTAGGAAGTGFSGPQQADITAGVTAKNAQHANDAAYNTLTQQDKLLAALKGQNGFDQQTNVQNQQQALANQLAQANGVGTQNSAIAGLQNTAGMYQGIANGTGPNPAQAMLNQQTGNNIAAQNALMAGQRGAGANTGLLARQAAQQGAATQQQAVGQGATMQANQSLNALQGLAGTQSTIGSLGGQQVGQLQGQQAAQSAMANQMAGQQIAQTNNNAQAALGYQSNEQGALGNLNSAKVSSQGSINAANAGMANQQMAGQQKTIGGIASGIGGALGLADGGLINHLAGGGYADLAVQGPQSGFGQYMQNNVASPMASQMAPMAQSGTDADFEKNMSKLGGKIHDSMNKPDTGLSGPTATAPNTQAMGGSGVADSGMEAKAAEGGLAEAGGHVKAKEPSQKAEVPGNSYSNDKIPAKLSEGEVVIPRDVMQSADPVAAAAEFVKQTLAKKGSAKSMYPDGGKVIQPSSDQSQQLVAEAPIQDLPSAPAASPQESAPPATSPAVQPASTQANTQPAAPVNAPMPQAPLPNSPEDRLNEHMKLNEDLAAGKIAPETYKDLFNKKDTLGKAGTIFGLMLSGMGSGLTGQPNMLMDMMNKEIERDLAAQKENKAGGRDFLRMQSDLTSQKNQQALQKQDLLKQQADLLLNYGMDPEEHPELLKDLKQKSDHIWDSLGSTAAARSVTAHNISLDAAKTGNPKAIAAAAAVKQNFDQRNAQDFQKAKAQEALSSKAMIDKAKQKQSTGVVWTPATNSDVIERAIIKGQRYGDKPFKNSIKPGDAAAVRNEAQALEVLQNQYKNWKEGFDKVNNMTNAGEAGIGGKLLHGIASAFVDKDSSHAASDTLTGAVERNRDEVADQLKKDMNLDDKTFDSIFPSWKDLGSADRKREAFEAGKRHFKSEEKKIINTLKTYKNRVPDAYHELPDLQYNEPKNKEYSTEDKKELDKFFEGKEKKSGVKLGPSNWYK